MKVLSLCGSIKTLPIHQKEVSRRSSPTTWGSHKSGGSGGMVSWNEGEVVVLQSVGFGKSAK